MGPSRNENIYQPALLMYTGSYSLASPSRRVQEHLVWQRTRLSHEDMTGRATYTAGKAMHSKMYSASSSATTIFPHVSTVWKI